MEKKNFSKNKKKNRVQLKEAKYAVKKANKIENPLSEFTAFSIFKNKGITIYLEYCDICNMSEEVFYSIFQLQKKNMESIYNSCSWGWNEKKKYDEMRESTAKYLIGRDENCKIVAFSHFRFDMDYGHPVLYCYELQLDSSVHSKGLGKFFLQVLELIAFKNQMSKVVLTVLKHNLLAIKFFYSQRYEIDDTNPEDNIFEDIPYQILSKRNPRLHFPKT